MDWLELKKSGKSIFIHGDCMDYLPTMPDKFAELAIVDPPYQIKRFSKSIGNTRFLSDKRVSKNGIVWDKKPSKKYFDFLFKVSEYQIIWGANNFALPESEYFIVWSKKQTVQNFADCEYAYTNIQIPAKLFEYSIHKHNHTTKIHPTQKPVALYRWLLHNYAKPGDLILDTHVGSASSLIACEQMGFQYVGIEKDRDYYDAACERMDKAREKMKQEEMFEREETEVKQESLFESQL